MKVFYFTATGNSLYVGKKIGGELYSIPQMLKNNKNEFEDDCIGFVFPCYAFGLPRIVVEFINKSNFKAKYFFAVVTYGNKAGGVLNQIETLGRKNGIVFNYTSTLIMVDNYLPGFDMDKQIKNLPSKKIEENLNKIIADINSRNNRLIKNGFGDILLSKILYNLFKWQMFDNATKLFSVDDKCITCKICEKVCPVNNINIDKKPVYLNHCESCLACIQNCPQKAIHIKFEKNDTRFVNPNVKLAEIIEANNQK